MNSSNAVHIARQPIFNRKLRVDSYELLYRNSDTAQTSQFIDGDHATSHVLLNSLIEIGLDRIVGKRRAHINLTRNYITGKWPIPLNKDAIGLEVLEDVGHDEEIVASLINLRAEGYRIALDDFVYQEHMRPLLALADTVKLDLEELGRDGIAEHVRLLNPFNVKLVAERVETADDLAFCQNLGFDYFQGYFFAKPNIVSGKSLSANQAITLQLLAEIQNPHVSISGLETIIKTDVALSFKLLRYINSAFFNLPREVNSVRDAIVFLGLQPLKTWVSLMILAKSDDKPQELITLAMIRAKMCERLAQSRGKEDTNSYFTVGLFSCLDTLLDQPMNDVLTSLPLSYDIRDALVDFSGDLGQVLSLVLDYEKGVWSDDNSLNVEPLTISTAYLDALDWSNALISSTKINH